MLVKTRGIVLNFIKFRETSIIAKVYTEQLGLQTYIVNGVRQKTKSPRIALFQPFTLLDMVVYTSHKGGITRISEYKCSHPFTTIPFDIRKSSMLLFLSEVVARSVQEEEENPPLFQFLHDSILTFDRMQEHFENFHLVFLLQLAHYLGFGVETAAEIISQVAFSAAAKTEGGRSTAVNFVAFESYLDDLMHHPDQAQIPNGRIRRELLHIIIRYFQLHIEKLGEIRSLDVLAEVLSD